MAFEDFDLEIQDEKDSDPEQFNDTVTTAGTPKIESPTSAKPIQLALIKNPNKGPNANSSQDVLLIIIDGGSQVFSISRGEYVYFPGVFSSISIDTNTNGTNYELILWS